MSCDLRTSETCNLHGSTSNGWISQKSTGKNEKVYLLQKYGNCRKHHILVTANVFIAWYFAFIIICILPLDVSSTAYRQCLRDNFDTTTPYPVVTTEIPTNSSEVSNASSLEQNKSIQNIVDFQGQMHL
ncbi:hypothetical protein AVEN_122803-1 [Araneus ventricosus]|uniref:Uncharacterized protein n=1 Tax=Araneus ventricosus TaxID=182803 RepID=A0A4Y2QE21_ARAVE|nr:hypothetical protein AVEN_122803-1 [Araneus ventricosus]